ncbi:MAG: NAD-dependent epimerase/dehydratase family protein [Parvularculaceae bacterium]
MTLKVGFLGAGYIARWHADALKRVKGARLVGVCDLSAKAAQELARATGARVYASLDEMLGDGFDCIHLLTPPQAHFEPLKRILSARVAAFVEKPFVLSSAEARELCALAADRRVALGVNHNFLMLPAYDRLKADIASGVIGPIDSLQANWRFTLPPLRSGPYELWMLRAPQNILFELGPHLFAFVADLLGDMRVGDVRLRYPIEIPGGVTHYQGWRIEGVAGETAVTLDLSLIEGMDDRSLELRGVGALGRFDFASDAYSRRTPVTGDIVIGPMLSRLGEAGDAASEALSGALRQASSLNALAPYGLSFKRAIESFCRSLATGGAVDRRLSPELASSVIGMIETAVSKAAPQLKPPIKLVRAAPAPKPTMLAIGGAGFIGRALVERLASAGTSVRVFSRGKAPGMERADGRVEVFTGDLKSEADLLAAMDGVEGVFHLARADEKTWSGYLENDVGVTRLIGEACLKAKVKRLVYTGTIASFDATRAGAVIDHQTPLDPRIEYRDLYARSKAACELALKELAGTKGLPLVIARPGIVIGRGGPLQHWGIAMWRGAAMCKLWGDGRNIMPFVDVDDVADGLVRAMTTPGVEGRAFFLVGDPMLSAVDYFDEIARAHAVRIDARPTPIWRYFLVDFVKAQLKRRLAGKKDIARPTLHDWKNRAALSRYDNSAAKVALDWRPISDRAAFVEKCIVRANLFGVAPAAMSAESGSASHDNLMQSS